MPSIVLLRLLKWAVLAALSAAACPATASTPCSGVGPMDAAIGLRGDDDLFIVPLRFTRRMWTHDGHTVFIVQQAGDSGRYLSMYSVPIVGGSLQYLGQVGDPSATQVVDGTITPDGDLLLAVSTRRGVDDVSFHTYTYGGEGSWTRAAPRSTVVGSSVKTSGRAATLAVDTFGTLFVAYVERHDGAHRIRYSYSTDGGSTWTQAPAAFTQPGPDARKTGRLVQTAVDGDPAIALVYFDDHGGSDLEVRWDYRLDSSPDPSSGWTLPAGDPAALLASVESTSEFVHWHWSAASAGEDGIVLAYEDDGVRFTRYDGNPAGIWDPAHVIPGAEELSHPNIAASHLLSGMGLAYIVANDSTSGRVLGSWYHPDHGTWSPWYPVSSRAEGLRRPSSPERFESGNELPMLFQHKRPAPVRGGGLRFSVGVGCP